MMSRNTDSSLHTFELAGTSAHPAERQRNNAIVLTENLRLKKENDELWLCLKLLRDNSELECANLISSVIAWCDAKFKHRFIELNAAINRNNLSPSPFRPITPVQSPTSDNYSLCTGRSPYPNLTPDLCEAGPSHDHVSKQDPFGTVERYSPFHIQSNRGVSPTQGSVYYGPSHSDGRLVQSVTPTSISPVGHGSPRNQQRKSSPTQGSVYGSFPGQGSSRAASVSVRSVSPIIQGTIQGFIISSSPTQGSVYESYDEGSCVQQARKYGYISPQSVSPCSPLQTISPTHGSVYESYEEMHNSQPGNVSPQGISPVIPIRSASPARVSPTVRSVSPTQGVACESYVERISPRSISPVQQVRSISPVPQVRSISPVPQVRSISPVPQVRSISPVPQVRSISPVPQVRRISPVPQFRSISPVPQVRSLSPIPQVRSISPVSQVRTISPLMQNPAYHEPSRPISPRGFSPVVQIHHGSTSSKTIPLYQSLDSGISSAHTSADPRSSPTQGSVLGIPVDYDPGSYQSRSPVLQGSFEEMSMQAFSPTHGSVYGQADGQIYLSSRGVSPVGDESDHTNLKQDHSTGFISQGRISPVVQRSPTDVYQTHIAEMSGHISHQSFSPIRRSPIEMLGQSRQISPTGRRSPSPVNQLGSPLNTRSQSPGNFGHQSSYGSARNISPVAQRSPTPIEIQSGQMLQTGWRSPPPINQPGSISPTNQRFLDQGGIGYHSGCISPRNPSPVARPPPIEIQGWRSPSPSNNLGQISPVIEQFLGDVSPRSVSPVARRSPSPIQQSISPTNQPVLGQGGVYVSDQSISPVDRSSPTRDETHSEHQTHIRHAGYRSPRMVSPGTTAQTAQYIQRQVPTAPPTGEVQFTAYNLRSASPRSISPAIYESYHEGRQSSRSYSPDPPASPYQGQMSPVGFNQVNLSQFYHSPDLINSPFYRPISPSQMTRHDVSPLDQRASPNTQGQQSSRNSPSHVSSQSYPQSVLHQQPNDSSGFFQDSASYNRYPSTLDSNALHSTLNSLLMPSPICQQSVSETKTIATSPVMWQRPESPHQPQINIHQESDTSMTIHELSFGPAEDNQMTANGSDVFVIGTEEERVPTPYPYGPRNPEAALNVQHESAQHQPVARVADASSFGPPVAFSTPKKEPQRNIRVSPILEMSEQEVEVRRPTPVFQKPMAGSYVVRPNTYKPSHRLLGEIAFQLERRILDYIFAKRVKGQKERLHRRFYGYTVSNIPTMITREATNKDGSMDFNKKVTYEHRYDDILRTLDSFGYALDRHSYFCLKMINKYGLLSQPPDRRTMEMCGLQDPNTLRMFVCNLSKNEKERVNMMIVLECLLLTAHDDGQSIFLWFVYTGQQSTTFQHLNMFSCGVELQVVENGNVVDHTFTNLKDNTKFRKNVYMHPL